MVKICKKCGKEIGYNVTLCPECGEKLPRLSEKKKKYIKRDVITLVVIAVLVIVCLKIKDRNSGMLDIRVGDSTVKTRFNIGKLFPNNELKGTYFGDEEIYQKVYLENRKGILSVYYENGKVTGYEWIEWQGTYDNYINVSDADEDIADNMELYDILADKIASEGWVKISEKREDIYSSDELYPWESVWSNDKYPDKVMSISMKDKIHCGKIIFTLVDASKY